MLRLKVRRNADDVEEAVEVAGERLPEGCPPPRYRGGFLFVPGHPDVIDVLLEELVDRGLRVLARRLADPVRWR